MKVVLLLVGRVIGFMSGAGAIIYLQERNKRHGQSRRRHGCKPAQTFISGNSQQLLTAPSEQGVAQSKQAAAFPGSDILPIGNSEKTRSTHRAITRGG
jgi:hypothetical protein